jgi:hypothetical protein
MKVTCRSIGAALLNRFYLTECGSSRLSVPTAYDFSERHHGPAFESAPAGHVSGYCEATAVKQPSRRGAGRDCLKKAAGKPPVRGRLQCASLDLVEAKRKTIATCIRKFFGVRAGVFP